MIVVANKTDLGIDKNVQTSLASINLPVNYISAQNGEGLPGLEKRIVDKVSQGQDKFADEVVVTAARHRDILDKVYLHLSDALKAINSGHGFEFAAVDLREALNTLGEITGESVTDDILNRIFENFCIGK